MGEYLDTVWWIWVIIKLEEFSLFHNCLVLVYLLESDVIFVCIYDHVYRDLNFDTKHSECLTLPVLLNFFITDFINRDVFVWLMILQAGFCGGVNI